MPLSQRTTARGGQSPATKPRAFDSWGCSSITYLIHTTTFDQSKSRFWKGIHTSLLVLPRSTLTYIHFLKLKTQSSKQWKEKRKVKRPNSMCKMPVSCGKYKAERNKRGISSDKEGHTKSSMGIFLPNLHRPTPHEWSGSRGQDGQETAEQHHSDR